MNCSGQADTAHHAFCKSVLYGRSLGNRARRFSHFPPLSPSPHCSTIRGPAYHVLAWMSPWADSPHPAHETKGHSPLDEQPPYGGAVSAHSSPLCLHMYT